MFDIKGNIKLLLALGLVVAVGLMIWAYKANVNTIAKLNKEVAVVTVENGNAQDTLQTVVKDREISATVTKELEEQKLAKAAAHQAIADELRVPTPEVPIVAPLPPEENTPYKAKAATVNIQQTTTAIAGMWKSFCLASPENPECVKRKKP